MFPDGRRLPEDEIGTIAHGGVGYLAWRTHATVIPVRITNAYSMSLLDFIFRKRKVSVLFDKPLLRETLFPGEGQPTVEECKDVSVRIMQRIKDIMCA